MALKLWGSNGRRVLNSGIAIGLSALVVAAVVAPGLPATHVSANDGGVWITSNAEATFARYVDPIAQIDDGFGPPGGFQTAYRLNVLQQGTTVVAENVAKADIYPVDVVQGTVDPTGVALPGGESAKVALGGTTLAVLDTLNGKVWATDAANATGSSFSPTQFSGAPLATIKGATAIEVSQLGTVYVATSKALWTIGFNGTDFQRPSIQPYPHAIHGGLQLSVVGTIPVIFEDSTLSVYFPTTRTQVVVPDDSTSEPTLLQQVGPATTDVLVATSHTLDAVPLAGGSPTILASVDQGNPARPVYLDGCSYGAWAGSPGELVQSCQGEATSKSLLLGAPLTTPIFRVNNGAVLLNDENSGDAWSVSQHPKLVITKKDYEMLTQAQRGATHNNKQTALVNTSTDKPTAQNVNTEAHPGSIAILHLLDYASNPLGGPLSIVSISPPVGPGYQAEIAADTQTVSLQLDSGDTSPIHFAYTVMNAKGFTATASVTVNPTQISTTPYLRHGFVAHQYSIASTATATYQVLSGWRDAQNDPLALLSATSSLGSVSWTGTGLVTLTAPTVTADTPATISYVLTNGDQRANGVLHVEILGAGTTQAVAAIAEPNVVQVNVGQPVTVDPLTNNIPGADPLHPYATLALAGPVVAPTGLSVVTDIARGTVSIRAQQQGIFVLPYQVAFGSAPLASSEILVIARPPIASQDKPVTTPASVLLHGDQPATLDVLASDYDPSGGLLTVVSATAPTGVQVAVVKGKWLRIESTEGSFPGWLLVNYQVTNGLSSPVNGVVAVAWTPLGTVSPPIVPPLSTQVLAGQYIDVRALDSAVDPTGGSMELVPGSVSVSPANAGSAYIEGGVVRYVAPSGLARKVATDPVVSYVVEDQFGEETTGTIQITVLPTKNIPAVPPTPPDIDVRAVAGARVVIPIQTTGIDSNGESSAVVGIVTPPQLGRILSMNATSITYQAYPNVAGTDTFSYAVENTSGLQGTGTIRVGIIPPQGLIPVTATPAFVTAAPGSKVVLDLLDSVIASPQANLTIASLASINTSVPHGFTLRGGDLYATAPANGQSVEINYGALDGVGAESQSTVTIRGQAGYRAPPYAADYYPGLPANGHKLVVNVLAKSYNVGGGTGSLRLVRVFGSGAQIHGSNVQATVAQAPRDLTYEIANKQGGTALGIIHLPGLDGGAVTVNGQNPIQVPLGGSKTVNIDQYVRDPAGKVRLVADSGVVTSPAAGLASHPESYTTVNLTDVAKYNGPGDLMVQVTAASKAVTSAVAGDFVSLPVQVGPAEPILSCPTTPLQLVQGGASLDASIASMCELWVPAGVDPASLSYQVSWAKALPSVNFTSSDNGREIQLVPGSRYVPGALGVLNVQIGHSTAHSRIYVTMAPAPLASMRPITVQGVRDGQTVTVDVAQAVTSPLAHPTIKVLSARETSGPPAQVQVSGANVLITPSAGAIGIETFAVSVTDVASEATTRDISGAITLQLLAPPGPPGGIQATPGNGSATLTWSPASTNGSPIDFYQLTQNGSRSVTVQGTSYVVHGLQNGQTYSFTVRAHNSQGFGPPTASTAVTPQALPGSPGTVSAVAGNRQVALQWGTALANGDPVTYQVSVTPAPPSGVGSHVVGGTSYVWSGLSNEVGPYTFTVTPINKLGPGPSVTSTPVYTYGTPPSPGAPVATGSVSPDQTTTTISVSWPTTSDCNDARPCASYTLIEYRDGSMVATLASAGSPCSSGSGELCQTFGPLTNDGSTYTFALRQTNAEGQTSPTSAVSSPPIQADGIPGSVGDLSVQPKNQSIAASFTLPPSNSSGIAEVNYSLSNGSGGAGASGTWSSPGASGSTVNETIAGLVNGDTYSLTVVACNAVGECGATSNTATAVPYGKPQPPSVTATPNGETITYAWSGGGDNGRPVATYNVTIGSSSQSYPTSSQTSDTYACNTTHTISATVTDSVGQTSSAATVTATTASCPPPSPPTVSATSSGSGASDTVTFSWSGGGGSGLTVTSYNVSIDGASPFSSGPSSQTDTYACNTTHTISATVTDSSNQNQTSSAATASVTTASCPASPSGSLSITFVNGDQTSMSWSNLPPGYTSFYCNFNDVTGRSTDGPYYFPGSRGGSGSSNSSLCFDDYANATLYVTITGSGLPTITSNTA